VRLLSEYQNIDNIYTNIDQIKGKLKEKLETNKEMAMFSRKLATIETDFDNDIDYLKSEYTGYDQEKLIEFYTRMNLYSFVKRMNVKHKPADEEYVIIKNTNEIKVILSDECFLHLEYFGKNYHQAKPLGFAVIFSEVSYFIPFDIALESKDFVVFLESENKRKYVFDLKALIVILKWNNINIQGIEYDLLLAAYLANSSVNQDEFRDVTELFNYHDVEFEDNIYGRGAKFHLPEEKEYIQHAISKAKAIASTKADAMEKIKEYNQENLLNEIEIPLAKVLANMEYEGISVNKDTLEDFGEDLKTKIKETEKLIYDISGIKFNISSPKQLGEILFEKMELPVYKKTKTGYSTDISVLTKLRAFSPIVDLIISYRTYTKLHSTYYEGLKQSLTLKADDKIHTIYQQALTKTGRLSSKEPNLQNIPIRNEEGRALRKVFEPTSGHILLSFDYSQIELRVLAELGNVLNLKQAFINNKDIHEETAKLIFRKDNISKTERSVAKAVNFSIIYGKTAWGLSEDLNISIAKAKEFIDNYYSSYQEIKIFMDNNKEFAKENGYVKTYFNRVIHIKEIQAKNYQTREFGKRIAMNAPIQGTAADILKIAMVKIAKEFIKKNVKSKMILQIHDEIVLDVVKDEEELVTNIVKDIMENAVDFSVNLTANYSSGKNLYEVK
ncbi:MAG: DNA polymerase I, partial [Tenericutes bacterium]|nr:DNA polymerase I [Mycoplasmatota bacterium]